MSCKAIEKPVDKVAYFVDTYANYNDHELGFAVLDFLRANSVEVILPKQLPAPLPAIVYGDLRRARRDLSYSVKHLAKAVPYQAGATPRLRIRPQYGSAESATYVSGMSIRSPLQGFGLIRPFYPGRWACCPKYLFRQHARCPGLVWRRPCGARE